MHAVTYHPEPRDDGAAGGPAGLEGLFREHHRRVYRTALRITGNPNDAEDVLQTVFLRLARRNDDIDLSGSAATYLHRAAVNGALDLLRARRRSSEEVVEDLETTPEATVTEADPVRRSELARSLRRALAKLSPKAAEIFTLRYLEGQPNRDIARLLGSSQTAVAVILHRSRRRLAHELADLMGE